MLTKEQIAQYVEKQGLPYGILFVFGLLLCRDRSVWSVIAALVLLGWFAYGIHRVFHWLPLCVNPHLYFHHDAGQHGHVFSLRTLVETLVNVGFFVLFYLLTRSWGWVDPRLVWYGGGVYVSIHILNYSWLHTEETHQEHHRTRSCNFGPDIVDHLMGTACDPNRFEDLRHMILNCAVMYMVVSAAYRQSFV